MAIISLDDERVYVSPNSPREVARIASVAHRVSPGALPRRDGSVVCDAGALAYLALELPPAQHSWDAASLVALERQEAQLARRASIRAQVEMVLHEPQRAAADYPLLHRLDAHQVDVLAALSVVDLEGLGLFDEQGTGKTISCLCGFDFLRWRGRVDQLLVVAPKSMAQTWANTAREWFPKDGVAVVAGSSRRRTDEVAAARDVLVVTYEATVRAVSIVIAWACRQGRRTMLVVDESFFVKNPNTERSRAVAEVRRHCIKAIVACGTPAPNAAVDIVHQMDVADMGHTFADRSVRASEDAALIATTLHERAIFLRRLKHQVLANLPSKAFTRLLVPLAPRQREMYRQVRDKLALEVRSIDNFTFEKQYANFLAKRIALLQLCSHPGALDAAYDEVPAKIRALDILLRELVEERKEKVVLWSFFTHSLDVLASRYAHYNLVRVDGTVTDVAARAEAVRAFQQDTAVRLFIGNPAAAGAGITLTAARHSVYESFSNQAAHYLQSLDRIHRRGQTRDVEYHVLLCDGTVELPEYNRLLEKEERASELLGDPAVPRLSREEFLAELFAEDHSTQERR